MANSLFRTSIVFYLCIIALLASCTKKPTGSITVTTKAVSDITENSAKTGGSVTCTGYAIGECGVCYSETSNPTVSDNFTKDHDGTGTFNSTLSGLKSATKYYVRAYAKTSSGIEYGNQVSFTTLENGNSGGGGNGGGGVETPPAPTGAIRGLFSVSATQQVWFSKGNLQYQASTNTWRFAEHQWGFVGTQTPDGHDNFGGNISGSDNSNISSTYNGWIDLFCWGTSGWNCGNTYYQPWDNKNHENILDGSSFGPPGQYNLTGNYAKSDWGVNNAISNGGNTTNTWRTLTAQEWQYIFDTRTTHNGIRYAKAQVNSVNGVILLPDNWSTSFYDLTNTNTFSARYYSNIINSSQWTTLEQHGAVFLPAAGRRFCTSVYFTNDKGHYWSSSYSLSYSSFPDSEAYSIQIRPDYLSSQMPDSRDNGYSVRLVQPAD